MMIKTIKQLRESFWLYVADDEMRKEYRKRKTQNDYSTDIRVAWVDYVDSMQKSGYITRKLADRAIL